MFGRSLKNAKYEQHVLFWELLRNLVGHYTTDLAPVFKWLATVNGLLEEYKKNE